MVNEIHTGKSLYKLTIADAFALHLMPRGEERSLKRYTPMRNISYRIMIVMVVFAMAMAIVGTASACDTCGCTRTQGYWKNHDSNLFSNIVNGIQFRDTGYTWYQLLTMPPKGGNPYILLAHHYIAERANYYNGACEPREVYEAKERAEELFCGTCLTCDITGDERTEFIEIAELLDRYNNGLMGVPHCDD
jgi:hypothetical protein